MRCSDCDAAGQALIGRAVGQRSLPGTPLQIHALITVGAPQFGWTDQPQLCCGRGRGLDGWGGPDPLWLPPWGARPGMVPASADVSHEI